MSRTARTRLLLSLSLLSIAAVAAAAEPVDWEMVTRIRDEGLNRSQVMDTLEHLTETIGPRVTGSPEMRQANDWTRERLAGWGLDAWLESYDFGRGWGFSHAAVHLVEPHRAPLSALPKGWTRGTAAAMAGQVVAVSVESEEDFERYRGKIAGKILLLTPRERGGYTPPGESEDDADPARLSAAELAELVEFEVPDGGRPSWRARARQRYALRRAMGEFLRQEGVLATVEKSSFDNGIVRVGNGGSHDVDDPEAVTALVMAAEPFQRLQRLLEAGETVLVEIDVRTRFYDAETDAHNTLAEIPGSDPAGEIVMAGAHLDSWHAGTGATDNAAACAVVMEAVRILAALGVEPRRTIRVALWSGEEQGLLGSRAYVEEHFATRPEPEEGEEEDPFEVRWPLTLEPGHDQLSVYFNLDNGAGRIRGVYAQENAAVVPIFAAWLEPFADLGATAVTQRDTSGTDHLSFDRVGLPGFQMIQDPLDYFTVTHHSQLDVLDHVEEADLKQSAVVLASFLYHAAMRDERLPRKPLPQEPPNEEGEEKPAHAAAGGH